LNPSKKAFISAVTRVVVTMIAPVVVTMAIAVYYVGYLYVVMGPTTVWSVVAAAVIAIAVTFASVILTSSQISRMHGCITEDLKKSSEKFQDHFEKTITAIKTNGEETRKTFSLSLSEVHKSLKEELKRP